MRYDNELLQNYFLENNITSTTDYSKLNLNRDYRIKEKCIECDDLCDRDFRSFINIGCYCKKHTTQIKITKAKASNIIKYGFEHPVQSQQVREKMKATTLERFGVEHPLQSQEVKTKMKTTMIERHGVEHSSKSQQVKDKIKATCLERLGFEYPLQSQQIRDKMKATMLERHGVENACCLQEVKDKKKETNLERFGFDNPFQSQEVRDKMKTTMLERHGVENASYSQEIKDKKKHTCLTNYGVENPGQSEQIKDKIKVTCLKKYGVEHPMQNTEISEKASKNAYKGYDYVFPSGRTENIQGYEKYMLNDLLFKENVDENDIKVKRSEVPIIWYIDPNGKKHRYFVDCFIKSQNRCIEVKSTWTAKFKPDSIYLKQQALKDAGYLCEIWIYDSKGKIVEKVY
jgi:hypothetical protein